MLSYHHYMYNELDGILSGGKTLVKNEALRRFNDPKHIEAGSE